MKLAATAIVAIPAMVLLALGIGEMATSEPDATLQHVAEAALLALLAWAGWRRPRVAGALLLVAGAIVSVVFFALVLTRGDPAFRGWAIVMWIGVALLVFAPPVIAGALLVRAARLTRGER